MNNSTYAITASAVSSKVFFDFSERIKTFNILSSYEQYIFPILYMDCLLTAAEFKNITEKPELRIKISIKQIEATTNSSRTAFTYCIQDKIFCVVQEDNYYIPETLTDSSGQTDMITARFVLIQEEDLNSNKKNLSGSFSKVNMQSLIVYLTNQLNQNKKTVISTPDNTSVIPQILIPFDTVLNTFKYIDTVYGVYSDGLKLFFDLDVNYVLNRTKHKLTDSKLYKNVIIELQSASNIKVVDAPNTISIYEKNLQYNNAGMLRAETTGTKNAFVLGNSAKSILTKTWDTDYEQKQKVYYQKYSNPFVRNQINPENDLIVMAYVQNANYDLINFINEFSIRESINGRFKDMQFTLTKYSHQFAKTKSGFFDMNSALSLKKI